MNKLIYSEFVWSPTAIKNYDKSTYKEQIDKLILSIAKDGLLKGLGHPERLDYLPFCYSRHITKNDRLTYGPNKDNNKIFIYNCKGHYTNIKVMNENK